MGELVGGSDGVIALAVRGVAGGVGEAVRPMETGYLACYKDAGDLSEGIKCLLDDPALRRRMRARCREVAEAEYDMALQTQRFEELYETVIHGR